jgi:F-type H+-transporting ATPase subunit a
VEHHPFTWISALAGGIPGLRGIPEYALTSAVITVGLALFALVVRARLQNAEAAVVPGERVSAGLLSQYFVEGIAGLAESVIGHHSTRYVPLLGSFFLFILTSNLLGLVPGFAPPTGNFNITLALGTISFGAYHWYGVRAHGAGYVRQFLGPVMWLAPLMLMVEIFSHAFRPISLAIRLFANLFADHTVLEIFTELVPFLLPVPFYALGAFVGVIQAFVFTMLSAIYIALAISHDH